MFKKSILSVFSILFLFFVIGCTDNELIESLEPDATENPSDGDPSGEEAEEEDNMPDEEEETTPDEAENPEETSCNEPLNYIFNENEGLVLVEFENAEFTADWKLKTEGSSFSGAGYMVWEGSQSLGNPGNGKATFTINIKNPGTYQFIWFSAVTLGDNGTEHNDTWLRFSDADDFFAQNGQGTSIVYPKDIGKTPNPEGASKDGWFKIYRSGSNLDFKWQSSTFDNNAHDVFVVFEEPGTYLMEVSARSSGHGIDKFVLFNNSVAKSDATSSTSFSSISCN